MKHPGVLYFVKRKVGGGGVHYLEPKEKYISHCQNISTVGWLAVLYLTALSDSISVYIWLSSREREKEKEK